MGLSHYYTPTRVTFGPGAEDMAAQELKKEGARRVLIHYGSARIEKNGLLDKIRKQLEEAGIEYFLLSGVVPNPRLSLVRKGIQLCRENRADFILAVGGGSVIDSAKCIGYGAAYDGDVWDFYSQKAVPQASLPVGCVLTMAAAGSEMSDSSVITNEDGELKRGCNSDVCRLRFALMNPQLTYSLPPYQTSCAIVDIMMHTMERYFTGGSSLPLTDNLAFALLNTVKQAGLAALEKGDDYTARASLMWASSLSHNGLMAAGNDTKGDWACHQLEHDAQDDEKDAEAAVKAVEAFYKSINMPVRIKDLGIELTDEQISTLAEKCTFFGKRRIGAFRSLGREEIEKIYTLAR